MPSSTAPADDGPTIQAHRGFAGVAPENTILAARTAAERFGAAWIEIDVQPTADGTVVCFHDATLDATEDGRGVTDATGTVWQTPTATVLDAEVLGSGETVPRLSALDRALPASVGLNLELKSPGAPVDEEHWLFDDDAREDQREAWARFVDAVLAALDTPGRPVVLSSFFEGAVAAAAERAPDVPRAIIVGADLEAGREVATRHDAAALNASAELLVERGEAAVDAAHDADLAVNAWTVREWETARDCAKLGVDGLIADYPFLDVTL